MTVPRINADIIECREERAWLEERTKRIQASDGAAVLGQSGWGSPLSVWEQKISAVPLIPETSEEWEDGHEQEPLICKRYERKFGGRVHRWPEYTIAVSRDYPWIGCTPDAIVEDPEKPGLGMMQIKTWSEYDRASWVDAPPLAVQIQNQIEMLVSGLSWGVIAVKIGRIVERFYTEPNAGFVEAMLPLLKDFWTCVEMRVAPPVDGSRATTQALARLHPNDNGLAVVLPAELDSRIERWKRLKQLSKRIGEAADGIENEIKSELGDNTFGVTPDGHWVSWKSQHRQSYTVSECDYRVLRECKEPKLITYAAPEQIDYKIADRQQIPDWIKARMLNENPHCRWCGATLTRQTATFEHVVPLSKGGTNDQHNLSLACGACNHERGDDATLPTTVLIRA